MAEAKNERGFSINPNTVLNSLAAAGLVAIAAFVFSMKEDVAVLKRDVQDLIKRDLVTRSEVLALVQAQIANTVRYPWLADKVEVLTRINDVLRRVEALEGKVK